MPKSLGQLLPPPRYNLTKPQPPITKNDGRDDLRKLLREELARRVAEIALEGEREEPLWRVKDVAAFLSIDPKTLYVIRAKRDDFPPPMRIGDGEKSFRWFPSEIKKWARTFTI